jgi:amino acid adenylation domain-containing protein
MPDDAAHVQRQYVAPIGATELAVAAIWADLLGVEQIGRDDHFFELGGHSLLAVRLLATLRRELGVEVSLRELFLRPRLADLCAVFATAQPVAETRIARADRTQPLPLSFAQQRLWLIDRLDARAGAAYHMPACLQLRGTLDREALQSALTRIVARHEALRTCFVEIDGQPWQQIAPADLGFALPLRDLSAIDSDAREPVIDELLREHAQQPFDLARGPLIRGQLLRLADDDHLLLLTQHHIISDGWSVGVLLDELSTLYRAFVAGAADPLPALPVQYADYAQWQRQWLTPERLHEQQGFWQDYLHGAPELLTLPTDRPRPAQPSHVGARCSLQLPAALTQAVQQLARRHGCSLYQTLLTGWAVLMSRLSGQDDIVIGTPVANRPHRDVETLLGFFVNTLALRVRLQDAPTVAELLGRVRDDSLRALEHQDLPFEQVVEAVQPNRSLAHSPLFQVMLAYDNTPGPRQLALAGVQATVRESDHEPAQFDLGLSLTDAGDSVRGVLVYATELFDAPRMQRLLDQFTCVLEAMVNDDQRRIDRIDLLGDKERHRLLQDFNQTGRDYPRDGLIHRLFEAQAKQRPDATALVFGEQTLSYAELNLQANRWAHRLVGLGVKPDDRVAIWAERCVEMVIAMLATLKAGAAYLPIDTSYPTERVADMLADAEPAAVLLSSDLLDRLPASDRPVLLLDGEADLNTLATQPDHDPEVPGVSSSHLAYVIYTSGSTGKAKGVMVEHRNVVQLVIDNPFATIGVDDCIVHCANPAFDASTWEIWGALLLGARVCIVPQTVLLDPPAFTQELIRGRVTAAFLTVSLFNQYAEAMRDALPRLNYLLFGGEKTDLRQITRVFNEYAPRHLVHCYGPTETTTFATTLDIPAMPAGSTMLSIGRPIGNARIYILDALKQPVPIGVPGEIFVGGDGVARGYLNRPELSAERFIEDPFVTPQGSGASPRMYRTGDLARWLDDGTIEYLARNDDQVKIRGFRVELGEVVSRLQHCAGVAEALVTVREDNPGDKRLVAYLRAEPDFDLSLPTLRAQLSAHLAEYMLPSAFVPLSAFPLTQNGKIDRRALPAPGVEHVVARPYEAPEGDIELALAEIWSELAARRPAGHAYP